MAEAERKQAVQAILNELRAWTGLKRLFLAGVELRAREQDSQYASVATRRKGSPCRGSVLFASGGDENAFHIVYCRMAASDLRRGPQRPVVSQLLRDHPYALFVFSNADQSAWHFLNVKFDEQAEKRRLVRRIAVRPGDGLRTAAERLALLVRSDKSDTSDSPLAIQQPP
jgi:hypothetical protein